MIQRERVIQRATLIQRISDPEAVIQSLCVLGRPPTEVVDVNTDWLREEEEESEVSERATVIVERLQGDEQRDGLI